MRSHPLEDPADDPDVESWAPLIVMAILALCAGIVCTIWDGIESAWRKITRRPAE
jgi:hypothetical protein